MAVILLSSVILGWLCTGAARAVALRRGFTSRVSDDRWGRLPVALGGGVGFVLPALLLAVFFGPREPALYFSIGLITAAGVWDDIATLAPRWKFAWQLVAAGILVSGGFAFRGGPPALSVAISLFWLVSLTNAFNLMDNMDGAAGSVALGLLVPFALCAPAGADLRLFALLFAGSVAGFLRWNLFPARVYMGDAGSQALGLTIGAVFTRYAGDLSAATPASEYVASGLCCFVPAFDVLLVIVARRLFRRPVSRGGRDHLSHRLVRAGFPERAVAPTLALVSAAFTLSAKPLLSADYDRLFFALAAVLLLISLLLVALMPLDPDHVYEPRRARRRYPGMGKAQLEGEDGKWRRF